MAYSFTLIIIIKFPSLHKIHSPAQNNDQVFSISVIGFYFFTCINAFVSLDESPGKFAFFLFFIVVLFCFVLLLFCLFVCLFVFAFLLFFFVGFLFFVALFSFLFFTFVCVLFLCCVCSIFFLSNFSPCFLYRSNILSFLLLVFSSLI